MAIVGPDYKFLCVDIGRYGKNSDGGIFQDSRMGRRFETGTFNSPNPQEKQLPGQNQPTPHVLIGDEAFALKPYLMRLFSYRQAKQDRRKEKYNYRLCRARRVVENDWHSSSEMETILQTARSERRDCKKIVKATCVLHNYFRTETCDDK
jgi:hypothetical protein